MIAKLWLLGLLFVNAALWLAPVPYATCKICYELADAMWISALWFIGWAVVLAVLVGMMSEPVP